MQHLIAKQAIDHYNNVLPANKGKPQPGKEWTCYAAIVATKRLSSSKSNEECASIPEPDETATMESVGIESIWVVSSATGSKCTCITNMPSHLKSLKFPSCKLDRSDDGIIRHCNECCDQQIRGMIVHDSHAEVLARRGLQKKLWDEIESHLKHLSDSRLTQVNNGLVPYLDDSKCLLKMVGDCNKGDSAAYQRIAFEVKDDINLHLYISDSPCGDASIYSIDAKYDQSAKEACSTEISTSSLNFTGAKVILSPQIRQRQDSNNFFSQSATTMTAREKVQLTSVLRLKSSRSNIPEHLRTKSMSCSDKICKWMVLGLQGSGIMNLFIDEPIRLRMIVVSRDPRTVASTAAKRQNTVDQINENQQHIALERALVRRARDVMERLQAIEPLVKEFPRDAFGMSSLPTVHVVNQEFPAGKAVMEKRELDDRALAESIIPNQKKQKRQFSSCGLSLTWQQSSWSNKRLEDGESCMKSSKKRRISKDEGIEITVGAKGMKQGKNPREVTGFATSASNISRYALFQQALTSVSLFNLIAVKNELSLPSWWKKEPEAIMNGALSYQETKRLITPRKIRLLREKLCDIESPLFGWLRSCSDGDFHQHYLAGNSVATLKQSFALSNARAHLTKSNIKIEEKP